MRGNQKPETRNQKETRGREGRNDETGAGDPAPVSSFGLGEVSEAGVPVMICDPAGPVGPRVPVAPFSPVTPLAPVGPCAPVGPRLPLTPLAVGVPLVTLGNYVKENVFARWWMARYLRARKMRSAARTIMEVVA